MFIGEYNHNLDEKGRMNMPAKFRRDLVGGAVITREFDHCLSVYPKAEWEVVAAKIAALPMASKNSRAFARLRLAGAWDVELDSQGRVMIPEYLRQYAAIDKHIIVAGLYNRIEIWDEDAWRDYKAKTEEDSNEIAESMGALGI